MPALAELGFVPPANTTGIHLGTGDFSRLTPEEVVGVINNHATKTASERQKPEHAHLTPGIVKDLEARMERVRSYVDNADNYPPGAKDIVRERHEAGMALPAQTPLEMGKNIISQFPEAQHAIIATDLDGTWTTFLGDYQDFLIRYFPGSKMGEEYMDANGRERFAEAFATYWKPLLESAGPIFAAAASHVHIREGVEEFVCAAKEKGSDVAIISANFYPFVESIKDRVPGTEDVTIIAVTDNDVSATDKGSYIEHFAKENPDRPLVYIGDGASDLPALENGVDRYVALYGALKWSKFAEELQSRGLPHFVYEDFKEVSAALREVGVF